MNAIQVNASQGDLTERVGCKHTPGPWQVSSFRDANDGYLVRNIVAPNGCSLAFIQHTAEDSANARLLAAAPELLAAAKAFDNCRLVKGDGEVHPDLDAALATLRAAIDKAEAQ